MGREANTLVTFRGQCEHVKVLLESNEIILRGAMSAKIPRSSLQLVNLDGELLTLGTQSGSLTLALGAIEGRKWLEALQKPIPTLAQKLGIDPQRRAYVLGDLTDMILIAALEGAQTSHLPTASCLLATLVNEEELQAAIAVAKGQPDLFVWCVYGKGKHATLSDQKIRTVMRENGFIDTKTSAVSEKLTATRYSMRAA